MIEPVPDQSDGDVETEIESPVCHGGEPAPELSVGGLTFVGPGVAFAAATRISNNTARTAAAISVDRNWRRRASDACARFSDTRAPGEPRDRDLLPNLTASRRAELGRLGASARRLRFHGACRPSTAVMRQHEADFNSPLWLNHLELMVFANVFRVLSSCT